MPPAHLHDRWRPGALLTCHLLALMLMLSWLWPPTRMLWDRLDLAVFHVLNDPVHGAGAWAHVWAIGSLRPVDLGLGLVMLALMLKADLLVPAAHLRRALFAFVATLLVMLAIRVLFSDLVEWMGWQRPSASLVVEGSARLTELFPGWEARWDLKDSVSRSFPGDHASVLLLWAAFLSPRNRGWRLGLIWAVTALGILPRLVAGAHWVSDALVGSVLLCLLGHAWSACTPLAYHVSGWLERRTHPLATRLARLPLLGRISLISGR